MISITDTISYGDIFTGLSVIVAAAGIVLSEVNDRHKQRQIARGNVLRETLQSLTFVFEAGLVLSEKIKWQQVGIGEYTDQEIMDFGYGLVNKIRSLQPNYSVWATNRENLGLMKMKNYISAWQKGYARYLESGKNIPAFDVFSENVESMLQQIANEIRSTL